MPTTLPGDVEEAPETEAPPANQPGLGAGFKSGFKVNKASFTGLKSTKNKIFLFGGLAGLAAGVGVIFFFLLLFKNIHIKNLFLDYEFSKYNRAFRNRLEKSIDDPEANPAGNADSTTSPTDSPETALNEANTSQLEKLKTDPKAMDQAVTDTEAVDVGVGTGPAVNDALGIDSGIKPQTGTDEEVQTNTDTAIQDEVNQGLQSGKSPPNQAVQDAVDDTNKIAGTATTTAALEDGAIKGFTRGLNGFASKVTGPFAIVTIACIARDIFSAPGHIITKIRFQGLARSSAQLNKYADCQKQGKCSLAQVADVAQKFDNSTGSFTQSCAYLRAAGKVGNDCTELDPNYSVFPAPGSIPDALVRLSNALDGKVTVFGIQATPIADACGLILKPLTQLVFGAFNIGAAGAAAVTGVADFGISDVAIASVQAGSVFVASKYGKALALQAALYYGSGPFKRHFSAPDWGSIVGAGDKAWSTAACATNGCRQLSPDENTKLVLDIHADQVKANSEQGLAYRLFSPHNPTSTMGLIADRMPASPQTAMAAIGNFFASVVDPQKLAKGFMAMINPIQPAWAADTTPDTYGIPDYGFTDAELNQWGVVENSRWVNNGINLPPAKRIEFDKCFDPKQTPAVDLFTGDGNGSKCTGYNKADNPDYTAFQHYRIYKLDQRVTQDLVLLYNNQGGTGSNVAAGATSTAGCVNPLTDSRWKTGRTDAGVDYVTDTPLPVYAICDGTILSLHTPGWPDASHDVFIYYKLRGGPPDVVGKCIYVAENLTIAPNIEQQFNSNHQVDVTAGQQIATTIPNWPNTEWGWAQSPGKPSTPYPPGVKHDNNPTTGGQSFARFLLSLGAPVRDTPPDALTGPHYTGAACAP